MKSQHLASVAFFLLSTTVYAQADDVDTAQINDTGRRIDTRQDNGHAYVGLRAGWTNFEDACSSGSSECDDDAFGYGLYAGYQFTPWFALEVAATDYGSPEADYGASNVGADVWGSELSGVFSYDVSENVDAYFRVGAAYQGIDKESSWDGVQTSNEWGIVSAVGIDYRLSKNWSLRGEYQFIDGVGNEEVMQADMHFTSLGLTYHFGQKKQLIAAPAPVTEVPTKVEPVFIVTNVTLAASAAFDFDSLAINVNPELADLISQLLQSESGDITVTGHTDNTGTAIYNQRLSEARAQSIADHLARNGINPSRIVVKGEGGAFPVESNRTAEGRTKNRRVDITFKTMATKEMASDTSINNGDGQ